jgi:hypothetical protein
LKARHVTIFLSSLFCIAIFLNPVVISASGYSSNDNILLSPTSTSYLTTTWDPSSTISITSSDTDNYTTECTSSYQGQWSGQMNTNWTTSGGVYQLLQVYALVNERSSVSGGDSCFGVEFWDNLAYGVYSIYADGFGIGYSSELYSSGYFGSLEAHMTNSNAGNFTLTVSSDSWIIKTSQLKTYSGQSSNPTIDIPSSAYELFIMVGAANGSNVNFSGADGTIYYYQASNSGYSGTEYIAETSNMIYNSTISCSQGCTQGFHYP